MLVLKKNLKYKKNIILIHFQMKNTLKNNRSHTSKQFFLPEVIS
jgi:hypothetical protein